MLARQLNRPLTRFGAPLAAAVLIAAVATGQKSTFTNRVEALNDKIESYLQNQRARPARQEPRPAEREHRSDGEYEGLIERLELGMSALAELGRHDAHEHLARIADELRERRASARRDREGHDREELDRHRRDDREAERRRGESDEVRVVRERLQVMHHAVEAFIEAGDEEAAHRVEQAMHARELAIERRADHEATRIRESAPNREEVAHLLARAAELHADWDHPDRAHALMDLSREFLAQLRQRQGRGGAREREPDVERHEAGALSDLGRRIEILRMGAIAFDEAGRGDQTNYFERMLRLGNLQREGAGPQDLEQAAEGLSTGRSVELLREAAKLYSEWGHPARSHDCRALAEYYVARERRETPDEPAPDRERRDRERAEAERAEAEHDEGLGDLPNRIERLQREIEELRRVLRELDRVR